MWILEGVLYLDAYTLYCIYPCTITCDAELEVISVCWDALDGSTLYELLDGNSDLSNSSAYSIRLLMAAWYVSVGK